MPTDTALSIPTWMANDLAERWSCDKTQVISKCQEASPAYIIAEWLEWNGIIGYAGKIAKLVEIANTLGRK